MTGIAIRTFLGLTCIFSVWHPVSLIAEPAARKKVLQEEKVYKARGGADQTTVDFDAVDISGARRTPIGSLILENKTDKNYDFVKIRHHWRPEMLQSASTLSAPPK